jgi:hypothetical protein
MGKLLVALLAVSAALSAGLLGGSSPAANAAASAAFTPPPVKHVFVIVLENKNYDETFGPTSPASYLSKTLPTQGVLLRQFYGTGHVSLDNYVAMVSGQAPDPETQGDCPAYLDFTAVSSSLDANGQATGAGCVYPSFVPTIADQLQAKGLTWRGYMGDMGNDAGREATTCGHPALNSSDGTQNATATDSYAARHDPFVYFHTVIDDQARCNARVVRLENLTADLAATATTANYTFITPSLCDDGHDAPCKDGRPGGLTGIDAFLKTWVPRITASPAFRQDGLLLVTFDEAEAASQNFDGSACCNEQAGPNSPMPGVAGPGGGRVGAVALSPYITPGTASDVPYNHYSTLRSIEDLFGLTHLGFAGADGLAPFGADVYTATAAAASTTGASTGNASATNGAGNGRTSPLPGTGSWPWFGLGAALAALAVGLRRLTPPIGHNARNC